MCVHVKAPVTLAMELVSNANIIKVHFGLEWNVFVRYWKLLYFVANKEKKSESGKNGKKDLKFSYTWRFCEASIL